MSSPQRAREPESAHKTYFVNRDATAITCLLCLHTSYHPLDVTNRFCPTCHYWHEQPDL